jgi:hypothetical protein
VKRVSKESWRICRSPEIIESVKDVVGAERGSKGAELRYMLGFLLSYHES